MRKILMIIAMLCGCVANDAKKPAQKVEITGYQESAPQKLSEKQRLELRRLLDIYYADDEKKWAEARRKILAMGPEGVEALALFMIKFFVIGRKYVATEARRKDLAEYWALARNELVALKSKAVPYIIYAMSHPNMGTTGRLQCSMTLVQIGKPAVPLLLENLKNGADKFRYMVLETLGDIGDQRAVAPIISLYQSQNQPTAYDEDSDDESFGIRFYCVKAAGKIPTKESLKLCAQALDDSNPVIKKLAVETVTNFRFPEALPTLEKALEISKTCAIGQHRKIKHCIREIAAGQQAGKY